LIPIEEINFIVEIACFLCFKKNEKNVAIEKEIKRNYLENVLKSVKKKKYLIGHGEKEALNIMVAVGSEELLLVVRSVILTYIETLLPMKIASMFAVIV
jgi:hypothetical protein